jgi:hypothetical protein
LAACPGDEPIEQRTLPQDQGDGKLAARGEGTPDPGVKRPLEDQLIAWRDVDRCQVEGAVLVRGGLHPDLDAFESAPLDRDPCPTDR